MVRSWHDDSRHVSPYSHSLFPQLAAQSWGQVSGSSPDSHSPLPQAATAAAAAGEAKDAEPKDDEDGEAKKTDTDMDAERTEPAGAKTPEAQVGASGSGLNDNERQKSVEEQNRREVEEAKKESLKTTKGRKDKKHKVPGQKGPGSGSPIIQARLQVPDMVKRRICLA